MKGTFELKTPHDLLQKLRFDLDQLKKDATNTYLAFNFFVTAEHMKDWLFPGRANRMNRENLEKASPLLQVAPTSLTARNTFKLRRNCLASPGSANEAGYAFHSGVQPGWR